MHALYVQRDPAGRSRGPEAADQLVISSTASEREAHRRVVDLVHRARVVAEHPHETQVEDHAVGRAAVVQRGVEGPQAVECSAGGASHPVEDLWAASQGREAHERVPRIRGQPEPVHQQLESHEIAHRQALEQLVVAFGGDLQVAEQRAVEGSVAQPDPVAGKASRVQRGERQLDHLRLARLARHSDQLEPSLKELALVTAAMADGPVGVREVAEAQRLGAAGEPRCHQARDRDGHVRAQRQHLPARVEHAVAGAGRRVVTGAQDLLVLEQRGPHLAVAA